MNEKGKNAIAAILGITLLTGWALWLGHNGVILAVVVGIISGLGGYMVLDDTKEIIKLYRK